METNSLEIDRDRDLTEDEFLAERHKLEAEGFELVMTYDVSIDSERLDYEAHVRSLNKQGVELKELRKPNGKIQILKRDGVKKAILSTRKQAEDVSQAA